MCLSKGIKISLDILRMCRYAHIFTVTFPACLFFPCNVNLCCWNTNKQKIIAGQVNLTVLCFLGGRWVFLSLDSISAAAGTCLAVQLMCSCVHSTCHPHHQGWRLHGVLGHSHHTLAQWLSSSGVLHPGVLPTALAGRRGSQVSAAVANVAQSD